VTPERWSEVKERLAVALELEADPRAAYLAEIGSSDPDLRKEIESLLASHEEADGHFLSRPAVPEATLEPPPAPKRLIGLRLGPYQILEQIGAGGMGEVYRAFRADDEYRKEVAIKLIRAGRDSALVISRFKNERQILANLDHPNIARLLDGGTTEEGTPYLVMELIEGMPIDEYCDAHKLPTAERLKLFLQVCSAVQYAHQRLIIHRDIKPGNTLVKSDGVPKLLDFGIAKILTTDDAGVMQATMTGVRQLTPEYASPEQLRGHTITTASDVYSLGLVLYRVLTGHSPYRLRTHSLREIVQAACEIEPERPSSVIGRVEDLHDHQEGRARVTPESVGQVRDGSPEKLRRRLTGDLDTLVLKALAKNPGQRYSSAEQLGEDIRRHLTGLPIEARKHTVAYRVRKFGLRHRSTVAAAVLVFLTLVLGIVFTTRAARIARAQQARAERNFNNVRKLANALLFEVHDSIRDLPGATVARRLILERAQEYLDDLARESGTDSALLRELATAYERLAQVLGDPRDANLGDTAKALQNGRQAIELRRAALAFDPQNVDYRRELADGYTNLAKLLGTTGDRKEEGEYLRQALLILEPLSVSSPGNQRVQAALATAYVKDADILTGTDNQRARELYEKALLIYASVVKADPDNDEYKRLASSAHKHLGALLAVLSQFDAALEHYRQALAIDEAQLAAHPDNLQARYFITFTYSDTGFILGKRGDIEGALSYYRKALDVRSAVVKADPRDTRASAGLANSYAYIGSLLQEKRDYVGALESFKKALNIRQALAQGDPVNERIRFQVAEVQSNIGELYVEMANKSPVGSAERTSRCRESRPWLRNSLPVVQRLEAEGKLKFGELENRASIEKALATCDGVLGRSEQPSVGREGQGR
jgi:serine/threonine protein kinase/tetratricopeptide (TPR) repeat protein